MSNCSIVKATELINQRQLVRILFQASNAETGASTGFCLERTQQGRTRLNKLYNIIIPLQNHCIEAKKCVLLKSTVLASQVHRTHISSKKWEEMAIFGDSGSSGASQPLNTIQQLKCCISVALNCCGTMTRGVTGSNQKFLDCRLKTQSFPDRSAALAGRTEGDTGAPSLISNLS